MWQTLKLMKGNNIVGSKILFTVTLTNNLVQYLDHEGKKLSLLPDSEEFCQHFS